MRILKKMMEEWKLYANMNIYIYVHIYVHNCLYTYIYGNIRISIGPSVHVSLQLTTQSMWMNLLESQISCWNPTQNIPKKVGENAWTSQRVEILVERNHVQICRICLKVPNLCRNIVLRATWLNSKTSHYMKLRLVVSSPPFPCAHLVYFDPPTSENQSWFQTHVRIRWPLSLSCQWKSR